MVTVEAHEQTRVTFGCGRTSARAGPSTRAGLGREYWDKTNATEGGFVIAFVVGIEKLLLFPLLLLLQWSLQVEKEDRMEKRC